MMDLSPLLHANGTWTLTMEGHPERSQSFNAGSDAALWRASVASRGFEEFVAIGLNGTDVQAWFFDGDLISGIVNGEEFHRADYLRARF